MKGKKCLKGMAGMLALAITVSSVTWGSVATVKAANETSENKEYHWETYNGKDYWYEDGKKQGTENDPKGVIGDDTVRGREICDPKILDAKGNGTWFWLDAIYDGAKAVSKEVWMPYIYQNEKDWDDETITSVAKESGDMAAQIEKAIRANKEGVTDSAVIGKWVRYDAEGKMIKGWYTVKGDDAEIYPTQKGNTYYYDFQTGLMAKGTVTIDGEQYTFDSVTGVLTEGVAPDKKDEQTADPETGTEDTGKDTEKEDSTKEPVSEQTDGITCVLDTTGGLVYSLSEYKDGTLSKVYNKACYDGMSEYDVYEYDASGKVKTVTTYKLADDSIINITNYEYDADGNLVKKEASNCDHRISGYLYEYDSDGRLTKETCLYENKYIANYYNYHYDEDGNCIKKEYVNGESYGSDVFIDDGLDAKKSERYEYDKKGNKIKTIICDAKNDDLIYDIITYEYDSDGNLIKQEEYDSTEKLIRTYEYRADGNPLKKTVHVGWDGTEKTGYSDGYEYDDRGRIQKHTNYNYDGSVYSYTVYECDAVGRPLKAATYFRGKLTQEKDYKWK